MDLGCDARLVRLVLVAPHHVIGARINHTAHSRQYRRVEDIEHPVDVGLDYSVPGLVGGRVGCQVNDNVRLPETFRPFYAPPAQVGSHYGRIPRGLISNKRSRYRPSRWRRSFAPRLPDAPVIKTSFALFNVYPYPL